MYKVYNSGAITRNQRFTKALLFGTLCALILAIAYGFICQLVRFEFSIVFIGIGYLIGFTIQYFGRGVQVRFSILAAILAALCFWFADAISIVPFSALSGIGDFFAIFPRCLMVVLQSLISNMNINNLLSLLFRAAGIYAAYRYARVVG